MGPSGSGKTSLLRTLAGLWNTGRGQVTFYVEDDSEAQSQSSLNVSSGVINASSIVNGEIAEYITNRPRDIFFLPQRPYMVLGTLRQQLLYPAWAGDESSPSGAMSNLIDASPIISLRGRQVS